MSRATDKAGQDRAARLAQALRDNLRRRKQQARARDAADQTTVAGMAGPAGPNPHGPRADDRHGDGPAVNEPHQAARRAGPHDAGPHDAGPHKAGPRNNARRSDASHRGADQKDKA